MNRLAPWVVLLLLLACTRQLPPAPEVTAVNPAQALGAEATPVRIAGGPFTVRVQADLDSPTPPQPLGDFSATLVSATLRVSLTEVRWVSATELSAVVPAALPGGSYGLEVKDPWERTALLEAAFTVAQECLSAGECEDGLSCTDDACVDFRCQRSFLPGFCLIAGSCAVEGTAAPDAPCLRCLPATNPLAWSPAADGTSCDDGSLCTTGETCTAQQCGNPSATVGCVAQDQCHLAGSCDPGTGQCSHPARINGSGCDDQDACTLGESCQDGSCTAPTAQISCPATDCLEAGSCDPLTGTCQRAELSACDDGHDCTTGDACVAGSCRGTPSCGDTQPLACLTLSTQGVIAPASIGLDPSCSRDLETPTASLQIRWDLDGDGSFDTAFAPLAPRTAQLTLPGLYRLSVEVRDAVGNLAAASRHVAVAAASEAVLVTTPADEQDLNATPQAPGGTGLSLREAILHVNALAASRTILFAAPMTLQSRNLPKLNPAGSRLAGRPGIRIDFTPATASNPCLSLAGDNQAALGLELLHCPITALSLDAASGVVVDSVLRDGAGDGVQFNGDLGRLGPGVEVTGFAQRGVYIRKTGNTVVGASIHHNALVGVDLAVNASGTRLVQNQVYENGADGITISQGNAAPVVWHNTLHANAGDGVEVNPNANGVDLRNNLLTWNLGFGAYGSATTFSVQDPNGVFGNTMGTYSARPPDAGSVQADPGYLAPLRGDFRLRPGSPMIDGGTPLALDVNGASDGGWFGPAPDLGAHESSH